MRPELDFEKFKKKHGLKINVLDEIEQLIKTTKKNIHGGNSDKAKANIYEIKQLILEYKKKPPNWNRKFHNELDTVRTKTIIESPSHYQNVDLGYVLEPIKFTTCLWCGKYLDQYKQQKYCNATHYKLDGNLIRDIKKKYHLPDEPSEILSWVIRKPSIYKIKNIGKDGTVYQEKIKNKIERKDMTLIIQGNWRCRKIPLTTKTRTTKPKKQNFSQVC